MLSHSIRGLRQAEQERLRVRGYRSMEKYIKKTIDKQSGLYQTLGKEYKSLNINQSYLCYENALYHYLKEHGRIDFVDDFVEQCNAELEYLKQCPEFAVKKMAIILLYYNNADITKECIYSIRKSCSPDIYELIVVDNASSDGMRDWLKKQKDIKLIENNENLGFPYGCNQGIAVADADSDILLLNNDTVVPENAFFWLRMGLYENEKTGAAGSVSNNVVNYQQVLQQFDTVEQWMEFARNNNVPMQQPYERKGWLVGFAMLIKRTAMEAVMRMENRNVHDTVREVLDHRFALGNFEDNDFSIRLLLAGYHLLLVKNSFIFHYGSKAFKTIPEKFRQLLITNREKLKEKYGMDLVSYSYIESALIDMINATEAVKILEVGCKMGATLARIESLYPTAEVLGLEKNKLLSQLAAGVTNVRNQDFLEEDIEKDQKFDVVIFDEVLNLESAEAMLKKAKQCLRLRGKMLISLQNVQCIKGMLNDKFDGNNKYKKKGFKLYDIMRLCSKCELQINEFNYRKAELSLEEKQEVLRLCRNGNSSDHILYEAEKYIFEVVTAEKPQ